MEAFERVESGIPSMDVLLDSIRLGDNVVFQVSALDEYAIFVNRFVEQTKLDGHRLIYLRFAQHAPLVDEGAAIRYTLHPEDGFEPFTLAVHEIVEREGRGAFYVFDCLSELQVAWAADLMMGNFFRVTCPFLFQLDTVAIFPILRGCHSFDTIARIRETTQVLLDVCSDDEMLYLHPVKVWNRYSPTMFMPHRMARGKEEFVTLTDAVDVSEYYSVLAQSETSDDLELDSWERCFQLYRNAPADQDSTICANFCRMMIARDERIRALFARYFTKEDYYDVKERMIGTGCIGGKSCGMLIARSIVAREMPDAATRMEPHDSFYIGDHVFYTFLVHNDLWNLRIEQKTPQGYFDKADDLAKGILAGAFPEAIRVMFRRMLEYFGQSPLIARSSSLLEDGFGNAFAGKYESVFCVNQGDLEERLSAFETAVKRVYASTMNPSALEYRAERGMQESDEQMSVLVQRVSGSVKGRFFYPSAAGVGYSRDRYTWQKDIDSTRGMLRIVCGLGTRAVDRTADDYPRIVHLSKPTSTTATGIEDRVRFSQHHVDVLDIAENRIKTISLSEFARSASEASLAYVTEHDYEAERHLRERGRTAAVRFATCKGFVEDEGFLCDMERVLSVLEQAYGYPVDIEYTVNRSDAGKQVICLLQCRPLQTLAESAGVDLPQAGDLDLLFAAEGTSMGVSQCRPIDVVVMVDASAYRALPYRSKSQVGRFIAEVNERYRDCDDTLMLLAPGRIGTSSPELGLSLTFAQLSNFSVLVEYDDAERGFMPELSFGSHMFQDLVEAGIFYTALMGSGPRAASLDASLLSSRCSRIDEGEGVDFSKVIAVYDTSSSKGLMLYYDLMSGRVLCGFPHV